MNRKGFTLIELLVVIAIIAILAAILFPVFAQAKSAAKQTSVISNQKQLNTASQIYLSDYDDTYFVRGTMNGDGASWGIGVCTTEFGCPMWDVMLLPYTKNMQLVGSPFDRTPARTPIWRIPSGYKRSYRVAGNVIRGLGGIAPWLGQPQPMTPTNASSIPAPASTILFTDQRDQAVYSCAWWFGAWMECPWWTASTNTLANDDPVAWGSETNPNVRYTMGIDHGNANQAVYSMADGSVRSRPKGFIFPGYQRRLNASSPVDNTLRGVCLDADAFNPNLNDCQLPQG